MQGVADGAEVGVELNTYKVEVLPDSGDDKENIWAVCASTPDDAIQLAFALDGGFGSDTKNATEMLSLAKAYAAIIP